MANPRIQLDEKDLHILKRAQADGRLPWAQLAREMGMSSPAILSRVRRLYKDEIILRHTTVLNRHALGYETVAYLFVALGAANAEVRQTFREHILALPEVQEFSAITGEYDYFLRVVLPSPEAIEEFVHTCLAEAGPITRVATSLATQELKFSTDLPL